MQKAKAKAKRVKAARETERASEGTLLLPPRVEAGQLACQLLQRLITVLLKTRNGRSLMTMRWLTPTTDPYATRMCVESVKSLVLRIGTMVPLLQL